MIYQRDTFLVEWFVLLHQFAIKTPDSCFLSTSTLQKKFKRNFLNRLKLHLKVQTNVEKAGSRLKINSLNKPYTLYIKKQTTFYRTQLIWTNNFRIYFK
jgi:hypothetical protein